MLGHIYYHPSQDMVLGFECNIDLSDFIDWMCFLSFNLE